MVPNAIRSNKNPKDFIICVTQLNIIYYNMIQIKKPPLDQEWWTLWEVSVIAIISVCVLVTDCVYMDHHKERCILDTNRYSNFPKTHHNPILHHHYNSQE